MTDTAPVEVTVADQNLAHELFHFKGTLGAASRIVAHHRAASEQSRVGEYAEREAILQNPRVNDAIQTALEKGELTISSEGWLEALRTSQPTPAEGLATQCSGDTQELRAAAIAICKAEARELGYIDEDVAAFDNPDGDDLLAVQAVERALRTTHSPSEAEVEAAGIFPRIVAHERALDAARNFIDAHFNNSGGKGVLTCVPAREDDDDVVLVDYIKQRRALSLPGKTVELLREARQFVSIRGATTEAEQKKLLAKLDSHLGEMK